MSFLTLSSRAIFVSSVGLSPKNWTEQCWFEQRQTEPFAKSIILTLKIETCLPMLCFWDLGLRGRSWLSNFDLNGMAVLGMLCHSMGFCWWPAGLRAGIMDSAVSSYNWLAPVLGEMRQNSSNKILFFFFLFFLPFWIKQTENPLFRCEKC